MDEEIIFKVGDRVKHKINPAIKGRIVGGSFCKPAKQNVRLQLTNGRTFDVTPYVLKRWRWK